MDEGVRGWDCKNLKMLRGSWGFGSFVGAILVNPGWEKVTCGGLRGCNTWREWNGGIDGF